MAIAFYKFVTWRIGKGKLQLFRHRDKIGVIITFC